MTRAGFAFRVGGFYGALFLLIGVYLPFFPLYLAARGLDDWQIGIVVALPLVVRIAATPLLTWVADRVGEPKPVLIAYALGTLVAIAAYLTTRDFAVIIAVSAVQAVFMNPIIPITDALALRGVRVYALDYGRMRLVGSGTFILANLVGGAVLDRFGPEAAIWLLIAAAASLAAGGFALPVVGAVREEASKRTTPLTALRSMGVGPVLAFLLGAALMQASHGLYYAFGTLHWTRLGIGTDIAGVLWAIGVVTEIALFAYSGRVGVRLGVRGLVIAAGAAAVLRWGLMAGDPPLGALVALQALHGLTFGAAHLAVMRFFVEHGEASHESSGLGLYSVILGVATGAVMLAAGPLYEALAGQAYLAMALSGCAGWVIAAVGLGRVTRRRSAP